MTIDTAGLSEQRPHLAGPLQLYGKWQEFQRRMGKLLPKERATLSSADCRAYPRELAAEIIDLFAASFSLPAADLSFLAESLAKGDFDFMKLPLGEKPTLPSQDMSDEELGKLLFLLSRPFFLSLRQAVPREESEWRDGLCPLCSARPALSSIVEGPKRLLHCSYCATSGPFRFIGCPHCGCVDTDQLGAILSEDEPGFRVATCDACKSYVKVAESSVLGEMSLDLADIASLPLDIIAQSKGYRRLAPNPISLLKME